MNGTNPKPDDQRPGRHRPETVGASAITVAQLTGFLRRINRRAK